MFLCLYKVEKINVGNCKRDIQKTRLEKLEEEITSTTKVPTTTKRPENDCPSGFNYTSINGERYCYLTLETTFQEIPCPNLEFEFDSDIYQMLKFTGFLPASREDKLKPFVWRTFNDYGVMVYDMVNIDDQFLDGNCLFYNKSVITPISCHEKKLFLCLMPYTSFEETYSKKMKNTSLPLRIQIVHTIIKYIAIMVHQHFQIELFSI